MMDSGLLTLPQADIGSFERSKARLEAAKRAATLEPGATLTDAQKKSARKAAEDFEAVFITQMLNPIFEGLSTDSMFGGGQSEEVYRSLMLDEVGKSVARRGGFGIADNVYTQILKLQEA